LTRTGETPRPVTKGASLSGSPSNSVINALDVARGNTKLNWQDIAASDQNERDLKKSKVLGY